MSSLGANGAREVGAHVCFIHVGTDTLITTGKYIKDLILFLSPSSDSIHHPRPLPRIPLRQTLTVLPNLARTLPTPPPPNTTMSAYDLLTSILPGFFYTQLFITPSAPSTSCTGKTIIVTGANTGLGKEAARKFVQLGAEKVILGCRNAGKGEAAKREIEASEGREGVVEVWELDLGDYGSVGRFVERAKGLRRLDVVVENAGISESSFHHPSTDDGMRWWGRGRRGGPGLMSLVMNRHEQIRRGGRQREHHHRQRRLHFPSRPAHPAQAPRDGETAGDDAESDDRVVGSALLHRRLPSHPLPPCKTTPADGELVPRAQRTLHLHRPQRPLQSQNDGPLQHLQIARGLRLPRDSPLTPRERYAGDAQFPQ